MQTGTPEEYDPNFSHWVNNPLISFNTKVRMFEEAILNAKAIGWELGYGVGYRDAETGVYGLTQNPNSMTIHGRPVTEEQIQLWADEAEQGYA